LSLLTINFKTMKKILLLISLFYFVSCIPVPAQTLAPKAKVETVKKDTSKTSLKNEVIASLKTEAVQDSIVSIVMNTDLPAKDSGWKVWLTVILGVIILIIGAIASAVPTKKNKWYLQIIQVAIRFIIKHLLAPDNKKTDGTNHTV